MPELPEVAALAADLGSRLRGRVIDRLQVQAISALKTFDPPAEALRGLTVAGVDRHGKFLDVRAGDLHLVVHLALMGWIRWRDAPPPPPSRPGRSPIAARLVLDGDGAGLDLTEYGTKKSLAVYVVRDLSEVPGIARLGPDPMTEDFTADAFAAILATRGRERIKGVLRNQAVIAGIGNAYSDEILHAARMSPYKPADMSREEADRLYAALRDTLADALARSEGLAASELKAEKKTNLRVHGRAGEPCPVCGDTIRQVEFSDTRFQYCPTCQTGGKPLADRVLSRLLK